MFSIVTIEIKDKSKKLYIYNFNFYFFKIRKENVLLSIVQKCIRTQKNIQDRA